MELPFPRTGVGGISYLAWGGKSPRVPPGQKPQRAGREVRSADWRGDQGASVLKSTRNTQEKGADVPSARERDDNGTLQQLQSTNLGQGKRGPTCTAVAP